MKKLFAIILLTSNLIIGVIGLSGCSDSTKIIFHGKNIVGNILPIVQDDEVFFPLNEFCDVIDATYKYTAYENKVTLKKEYTDIELFIEEDIISIDDVRSQLKSRPIIQDDVIYIPIQEVATALNYDVKWKSNKLIITETLSLLTKETDDNGTTYYEYDDNGNLLREYSDDYCKTYEYDNSENLLKVYNENREIIESYKYNEKGRLIEANDGSYVMKFDDKGNMIYREDSYDGIITILEVKYDSYNNIIYQKLTTSDSNEESITTYTYDNEGRLISEKTEGSGRSSITCTYDKHTITKNYVHHDGSKETSIYDYNENKLFTSIEGFNTIESINYNENEYSVEIITNTGTNKYVFNELNFLISAEFNGVSGYNSYDYSYDYSYDKYGNLLKMEDKDGNLIESYTYNDFGKIVDVKQNNNIIKKYEYDENGNLCYFEDRQGNNIKYKYDAEGGLIYKEVYSKNIDFVEKYKVRGGVATPIAFKKGTTLCEYMTVKK